MKNAAPVKNTARSKDALRTWDAVPEQSGKSKPTEREIPTDPPRNATGPGGSAPQEKVARWFFLLAAAAAGVVVGGLGSFGHRSTAAGIPTGLVLCLGGLIGLLLGLSELAPGAPDSWRPTRLSAVSCASAGWLLALIWLTYIGPPFTFARKGDVILPNDWKSITYLLGGMALIVTAAYRAWLASLNARLAQRPGGSGGVHPRG
ncbi:MAG TPA: DUF6113 family protein [Actinocrinis sp.]|nr:DUF6113 family protein [Actinocrinis sp.]